MVVVSQCGLRVIFSTKAKYARKPKMPQTSNQDCSSQNNTQQPVSSSIRALGIGLIVTFSALLWASSNFKFCVDSDHDKPETNYGSLKVSKLFRMCYTLLYSNFTSFHIEQILIPNCIRILSTCSRWSITCGFTHIGMYFMPLFPSKKIDPAGSNGGFLRFFRWPNYWEANVFGPQNLRWFLMWWYQFSTGMSTGSWCHLDCMSMITKYDKVIFFSVICVFSHKNMKILTPGSFCWSLGDPSTVRSQQFSDRRSACWKTRDATLRFLLFFCYYAMTLKTDEHIILYIYPYILSSIIIHIIHYHYPKSITIAYS